MHYTIIEILKYELNLIVGVTNAGKAIGWSDNLVLHHLPFMHKTIKFVNLSSIIHQSNDNIWTFIILKP